MPYLRNKRTGEMVFVPDGPAAGTVAPNPLKVQDAVAGINKTVADTTKTGVETQKTIGDITKQNREITQNPISETDQKFINEMRTGTGDTTKLIRDITAAQKSVDRFQPSPSRGAFFQRIVPEDNDWLPTVAMKGLVRGGSQLLGQVSQQEIEDYQRLKGLQQQRVLAEQQSQKGPQTESDAIRMMLADVSPNKDTAVNAQILADAQYDALMNQQEPEFYAKWANNFGSVNAKNSAGQTAGEVWAKRYQSGLSQMRNDPRYKRAASGGGQQPKVVDFNDLP